MDDIVIARQSCVAGCTCLLCLAWQERCRLTDEIVRLQAVVDAMIARPFRGTPLERRDRMYGSDWEAVHDALDALEARRG